MTHAEALALLRDFIATDHVDEGWADPNEHYVWDVLTCELYFKGRALPLMSLCDILTFVPGSVSSTSLAKELSFLK